MMMRTFMLMAAMTALVGVVGLLIGGETGLILALVLAAGMNLFAFWNSDKVVLRMQGAEPLTPADSRGLYEMTEGLAARAGLPMPALWVIRSDQPNAFATGRNPENAAVAVTEGLLRSMSREEVGGVSRPNELAHNQRTRRFMMTEFNARWRGRSSNAVANSPSLLRRPRPGIGLMRHDLRL